MIIEVAAAVIQDARGRYLITRRPDGTHLAGLWEFPGGKREPDETLEACLARELREELGATFSIGDRVATVPWRYPEKSVILHFFRCRLEAGTIRALESQAMAWVAAERLRDYQFPAADGALIERLAIAAGQSGG
jgi:8-oxo-dGTP diphosphatase